MGGARYLSGNNSAHEPAFWALFPALANGSWNDGKRRLAGVYQETGSRGDRMARRRTLSLFHLHNLPSDILES